LSKAGNIVIRHWSNQMVASCNVCARSSLCFAFSGADIEFNFVLMTSACSQYLKDSCKQHLALLLEVNPIFA